MWHVAIAMFVAQAPSPNAAHDALDSLDRLKLPTSSTITLAATSEKDAVAERFEPTQAALFRAGVNDAGLRLLALSITSLVLNQVSAVLTSLSQDPLSIGVISGLITTTTTALMHFLWFRRGGLDVFRAVELHNDSLLTQARTQWPDPSLAGVTDRLLLIGAAGRATVIQGGRRLKDDDVEQVLVEKPELQGEFRGARRLHVIGSVFELASFLVLGATPVAVGALRPDIPALLGLSFGGLLAAVGVMAIGFVVQSQANAAELRVIDAWNRELITATRVQLPLRVPEPDLLPEPEPRREEPPLLPPTSDVPLRRLIIPGLNPSPQ